MLGKCGECGLEVSETYCLRNWEGLLVCPQCGSRNMDDASEEDGDANKGAGEGAG